MDRFFVIPTPIDGVYVVEPKKIVDNRGYYERFFCSDEFKEIGFDTEVKQINHSLTKEKGVIRGFHYQNPPYCEMKLVRCIRGSIFDVALDVRKDSPTFLKHFSVELTENNSKYLLIPEGVAHAFQSLEDNSEILYIVNKKYAPSSDIAINPLDVSLNINWPCDVNKLSKEITIPNLDIFTFKGVML